jgi:hypothetical protein
LSITSNIDKEHPVPPSLPPTRAVRAAYLLVTGLLLLSLGFAAVAVVSMVVGVVRGGDSLLYGDTLNVPMQLSSDGFGPLPSAIRLPSWVDVGVEISDPTVKQMLLQSATDLGPLVIVIGALWLVRGVLRSVTRADPFSTGNVRRLRDLGVLLAVGGPLVALLNASLRRALYSELPAIPSVTLGVAGFAIPGGMLLGGLAAFVLAAIFAYGAQLRDDVAGTI